MPNKTLEKKNISNIEQLQPIHSHVLQRDIQEKDHKLVSDYAKVVLPFYREEAAKTIQSVIRRRQKIAVLFNGLQSNFPENQKAYTQAKQTPIYKSKTLYEPSDDGFQDDTIKKIKAQHYEQIDYQHNDFIRRLFGILRSNKITMNEMMTAKLMYEMLLCFNQNQMPENPQEQFQRYTLSQNAQGPYQPTSIHYWRAAETTQLNKALQKAESNEKFHYYTMDLKPQQVGAFFYDLMTFSKGVIKKHMNQMLQDYVQTKPNSPEKRALLEYLQESLFYQNNARSKVFSEKIQRFILHNEPLFKHWIRDMDKMSTERSGIQFLAAISNTHTDIPTLCRSPQYDMNHTDTPVLSFVLPTIDTLNLLQRIAHGEEFVMPAGVAGPLSTRMIRAYVEHSAAEISEKATSSELTAALYPTASLFHSSARPVELPHPDTDNTNAPHSYPCYDFLLSWHDFFHAWRSGSNFKALIKKLIQIHDVKAGFAEDKSCMSKPIWTLVDMDFSVGKNVRTATPSNKKLNELNGVFYILSKSGFDFSKPSDDNILLIYHLFQSPKEFKSLFFNYDLAEIILFISDNIELFSNELQPSLRAFSSQMMETYHYLQTHPKATIIELLLKDILKSTQDGDDALFATLNLLDCKTIFYWSKNTGVYFKKEFQAELNALNVNRHLRSNAPNLIRQALRTIIANHHPELLQPSENTNQQKKQ